MYRGGIRRIHWLSIQDELEKETKKKKNIDFGSKHGIDLRGANGSLIFFYLVFFKLFKFWLVNIKYNIGFRSII